MGVGVGVEGCGNCVMLDCVVFNTLYCLYIQYTLLRYAVVVLCLKCFVYGKYTNQPTKEPRVYCHV